MKIPYKILRRQQQQQQQQKVRQHVFSFFVLFSFVVLVVVLVHFVVVIDFVHGFEVSSSSVTKMIKTTAPTRTTLFSYLPRKRTTPRITLTTTTISSRIKYINNKNSNQCSCPLYTTAANTNREFGKSTPSFVTSRSTFSSRTVLFASSSSARKSSSSSSSSSSNPIELLSSDDEEFLFKNHGYGGDININKETISSTTTLVDDTDEATTSSDTTISLPEGLPNGFYVVQQYPVPYKKLQELEESLELHNNKEECNNPFIQYILETTKEQVTEYDIKRLECEPNSITLPVMLMLMDPKEYPTLSRARKACRQGTILLHRPNSTDGSTVVVVEPFGNLTECSVGRVIDRVQYQNGDMIGKQVRMRNPNYGKTMNTSSQGQQPFYSALLNYNQPLVSSSFHVPVLYEDDHFAIVDKPPGLVTYSNTGGNREFRHSLRGILPFVLRVPKMGTYGILKRPASVHRLDKPTSGIVVIAKTKPSLLQLASQFHDRIIQKTYTAIVNGIPDKDQSFDKILNEQEVYDKFGIDTTIDQSMGLNTNSSSTSSNSGLGGNSWYLINSPLDGKEAITLWRSMNYIPSLHAQDGFLTIIEIKLKTGRYHQIRRHMTESCSTPIVGDKIYDGGGPEYNKYGTFDATKFRGRGLFLCSNQIIVNHPYYNTEKGRLEYLQNQQTIDQDNNETLYGPLPTSTTAPSDTITADTSTTTTTPSPSDSPITPPHVQAPPKVVVYRKVWLSPVDDMVKVRVRIDLPEKFRTILDRAIERHEKFFENDEPITEEEKQKMQPIYADTDNNDNNNNVKIDEDEDESEVFDHEDDDDEVEEILKIIDSDSNNNGGDFIDAEYSKDDDKK